MKNIYLIKDKKKYCSTYLSIFDNKLLQLEDNYLASISKFLMKYDNNIMELENMLENYYNE